MGWGRRFCIVTLVLLISSVAMAEPAGIPGYVPVARSSPVEASVVVEPGDHLWKISQAHLDHVLGRAAGPDEVAPYWRGVIDANRDGLRSSDPDLIFPGEVIVLPPGP
jgi:nucleoid-associated protein YgaU